MASDSDRRDEVTIEVIYLLVALVAPIMAVAVLEAVASWLFAVDTAVWRVVAPLVLALAGAVGLGLAVILNREFRSVARRDSAAH